MNPLELTHRAPGDPAAPSPPGQPPTHRAAGAARAARRGSRLGWLLEGPGWLLVRPALDLLALVGAVLLVLHWAQGTLPEGARRGFVAFPPAVLLLLALRGLYARRLRVSVLDGLPRLVSAVSLGALLLVALDVYVIGVELRGSVLAPLWATSLLGLAGARLAGAGAQRVARVRGLVGRPALVVGTGDVGALVARRLQEHPDYGLRPIGFLEKDPGEAERVRGLPVLGGLEDVEWIASLTGAEHVIVAFPSEADPALVSFARRCRGLGLTLSVVPRLHDAVNDRTEYEAIGGLPLLTLRPTQPDGRSFRVKHALDRAVALTTLVVLSPALLAVAAAVKLSSPGPVLFRQRRVGRDGQEFDLLKFRSMRPVRGPTGFRPATGSAPGGVEGQDRRTAVGRLLRRTSVDELPQLLNVLRGDMSLVGPRPERPEFVAVFAGEVPRYADRHRVRSGITGWAQVHGLRGKTSLTDRVEWDNYYIEHWSFALDLKILVLTLVAAFRNAE